MACPDRKNDQRIIDEIDRRKALIIQSGEKQKKDVQTEYEEIHFEGQLFHLLEIYPEDTIFSITMISSGLWEVLILPQQE